MLRWRLLLGTLIIAAVAGLGWVDHGASLAEVWLPLLIVACLLGSREVLYLAASGALQPVPWVVYLGNVLIVTSPWLDFWASGRSGATLSGEWVVLALGAAVILAFVGEMVRYREPGGAFANLAAAVFAMVYVGLLLGCVVQLRLACGLGALASLLIVVKMGDTGAYAVGRLIGRHPLAPTLSPKKTIEGAAGAFAFSCAASWATFQWLVPATSPETAKSGLEWGWLVFGAVVCAAGMLGDLAESLIKRDVRCKDSSEWLPGFGGVLDVLDSVLLAAPAAYACWAAGLVGS